MSGRIGHWSGRLREGTDDGDPRFWWRLRFERKETAAAFLLLFFSASGAD